MATLAISGLSRVHPGASTPALDDVTLHVDDGETLVLVGPSGCGKSTLLRLVAGLDDASGGRVVLGGRDLAGVPPQDRDVAMVFQGYALYPHLTARENMAFPLKMRGDDRATRERKVAEAAALLGLEQLLDRRPSELSGGERQRVAMGRAIVRRPKLFLFDEPLANLDAALRTTLRVELAELLRKLGATAIYVTHDQVEAMTVGHRVAVLRSGKVEQLGTPRAIYERPATTFVAGFLGAPPMNLWPATRVDDAIRVADVVLEAPTGAPDELLAAVRPERVVVKRLAEAEHVEVPRDALAFEAKVVATEPLGAETVVHARRDTGGLPLEIRSKSPGFVDYEPGARVRIEVPRAALAWFARGSGRAIGAP